MSCWGLIVAAGAGRRLGGPVPKPYREVAGRPLLAWTLRAFQRTASVDAVVLIAAKDQLDRSRALVERHGLDKVQQIVAGGGERTDSVRRGLDALRGRTDDDLVAIHDAARPLVAPALIERVVAAAARDGAAIPAVLVADTVKRAEGTTIDATVDRRRLVLAQTPQVFRLGLIRRAHAVAGRGPFTDDAEVVERLGEPVTLVEGDPFNLKVTVADDLERAATLLGGAPQLRVTVGTGVDVHRLVPGRPLILGGVTVPFPLGLQGHSDADVLAHAVGDALLGAAGLGDLGRRFPPGDPDLRGISSMVLLDRIGELVRGAGLAVGNVDATVICQAPRLAPHVDAMADNMAAALRAAPGRISVKATTTEGLGFTGGGEGIAAHAVVLLLGANPPRSAVSNP